MRRVFVAAVIAAAISSVAFAQVCTEQATIGQFVVNFQGATYDGVETVFEYCVEGLDDPALSNWELTLDPACVQSGDLTSCGPAPCFYQVDDPNTGITGIKWDDVEVDPGETECFEFGLAGDWTGLVGDTLVGMKAGQGIHYGNICGPICQACNLSLNVEAAAGTIPSYALRVRHNRPPTVDTSVTYSLYNEQGKRLARWVKDGVTLELGQVFEDSGSMPLARPLRSGTYRLKIRMFGMSNWITRDTTFVAE